MGCIKFLFWTACSGPQSTQQSPPVQTHQNPPPAPSPTPPPVQHTTQAPAPAPAPAPQTTHEDPPQTTPSPVDEPAPPSPTPTPKKTTADNALESSKPTTTTTFVSSSSSGFSTSGSSFVSSSSSSSTTSLQPLSSALQAAPVSSAVSNSFAQTPGGIALFVIIALIVAASLFCLAVVLRRRRRNHDPFQALSGEPPANANPSMTENPFSGAMGSSTGRLIAHGVSDEEMMASHENLLDIRSPMPSSKPPYPISYPGSAFKDRNASLPSLPQNEPISPPLYPAGTGAIAQMTHRSTAHTFKSKAESGSLARGSIYGASTLFSPRSGGSRGEREDEESETYGSFLPREAKEDTQSFATSSQNAFQHHYSTSEDLGSLNVTTYSPSVTTQAVSMQTSSTELTGGTSKGDGGAVSHLRAIASRPVSSASTELSDTTEHYTEENGDISAQQLPRVVVNATEFDRSLLSPSTGSVYGNADAEEEVGLAYARPLSNRSSVSPLRGMTNGVGVESRRLSAAMSSLEIEDMRSRRLSLMSNSGIATSRPSSLLIASSGVPNPPRSPPPLSPLPAVPPRGSYSNETAALSANAMTSRSPSRVAPQGFFTPNTLSSPNTRLRADVEAHSIVGSQMSHSTSSTRDSVSSISSERTYTLHPDTYPNHESTAETRPPSVALSYQLPPSPFGTSTFTSSLGRTSTFSTHPSLFATETAQISSARRIPVPTQSPSRWDRERVETDDETDTITESEESAMRHHQDHTRTAGRSRR